jgi:hypothetical protein
MRQLLMLPKDREAEFQRFILSIDAHDEREQWSVLRIWRPEGSQTGHYKRVSQY